MKKAEKKLIEKIRAARNHRDYLSMELAGMPKNCYQEADFKDRIKETVNKIKQLEKEHRINFGRE